MGYSFLRLAFFILLSFTVTVNIFPYLSTEDLILLTLITTSQGLVFSWSNNMIYLRTNLRYYKGIEMSSATALQNWAQDFLKR